MLKPKPAPLACPHCEHELSEPEIRTLAARANRRRAGPKADKGRPRAFTDAQLARAQARLGPGATFAQLAAALGVSEQTVRRRAKFAPSNIEDDT